MAFDSPEYIALLLGTLVAFFVLPRTARLLLLLAASLLFYAVWSVPLLGLIVASAVVDFSAGLWIERARRPWTRRLGLAMSLCTNLGLLGYFKYANFFAETLAAFGGGEGSYVEVVLPPAISFYTFQTLSYTIDVYRAKMRPTRSFLQFFLYVCFFPQLIAGPIERARDLLSQLRQAVEQRFHAENFATGARMIAWGMFKKVGFADYCGAIADRAYASPGVHDGWTLLVGTYAFTLQIYFDFSAYSEIARGSARLFGIDLMRNFDQPYLTLNIRDFWRRWHISLSNWFRDYVYLALGGSRRGRALTLVNLVVTMFLSGLWHGAAWNFVVWGLFHGGLLLAHSLASGTSAFRGVMRTLGRFGPVLAWLVTFHLVVVGWVLFRVKSITDFPLILSSIARAFTLGAPPTTSQVAFIAGVFAFVGASFIERRFCLLRVIDADRGLAVLFYSAVITATLLLARGGAPQFIYFQF